MNNAYLLIGGNKGDREQHLKQAIALLQEKAGSVLAKSCIYETAPWGQTEQPSFLNQAILLETALDADKLMDTLLQIEQQMGRIRLEKYGPRTIDLDIIYFNDQVLKTSKITVPHPEMEKRRFVLTPLTELAPDFIHPVLQQSNRILLEQCMDPLEVVVCK